jgi:hypothetical protein
MNTFKGTPGPWKVKHCSSLPDGYYAYTIDGVMTDEEAEENRKLIAASKDMMEALQAIMSIQEENPHKPGTFWVREMPTHEMLAKAKAALSAALD